MTKHGTKIEWTHIPNHKGETWNPIVGCSLASPGCTNCYAMRYAGTRLVNTPTYKGLTQPSNAGMVWTGEVRRAAARTLQAPLHWRKPRSVFVNSMGDLFHEDVPDQWIDEVFAVMALCPQHIFIVLTKRAERMREYLSSGKAAPILDMSSLGRPDIDPLAIPGSRIRIAHELQKMVPVAEWERGNVPWPFPNVWLGVSAEDQTRANERIPHLLETPAAVRFVSCEPLLGPIDLTELWVKMECGEILWDALTPRIDRAEAGLADDPLAAFLLEEAIANGHAVGPLEPRLDWVICGGESGRDARPMHPDWARSLRDQCKAAGVPFFMKQMAKKAPIPEELLVREWPTQVGAA